MFRDQSQVVYMLGRLTAGSVQLLGTAFAVAPRKVATALHVVGADDAGLVLLPPRVRRIDDYQDTSDLQVPQAVPVKMAAADPIRDLCVLDIEDAEITFSHTIGSSDAATVGTRVITLGFPHANFGRMVLTQHTADVGARVLIENSSVKSKHLVLNTQAREGQSGGPVFDISLQTVLGVLVGSYALGGGGQISMGGVDPATLHQTTHAVSAEYLSEML